MMLNVRRKYRYYKENDNRYLLKYYGLESAEEWQRPKKLKEFPFKALGRIDLWLILEQLEGHHKMITLSYLSVDTCTARLFSPLNFLNKRINKTRLRK